MITFTIGKREKIQLSYPNFEDNWKPIMFDENIKKGVRSLQQGKSISIIDDGRGYELAIKIKEQFILEYQRQLSEKIKIKNENGNIIIKI